MMKTQQRETTTLLGMPIQATSLHDLLFKAGPYRLSVLKPVPGLTKLSGVHVCKDDPRFGCVEGRFEPSGELKLLILRGHGRFLEVAPTFFDAEATVFTAKMPVFVVSEKGEVSKAKGMNDYWGSKEEFLKFMETNEHAIIELAKEFVRMGADAKRLYAEHVKGAGGF